MFQKVVDLNYKAKALENDNAQLGHQLSSVQQVCDDLTQKNVQLRAEIDKAQQLSSKTDYWKSRSQNFEQICNELSEKCRSPPPEKHQPTTELGETLLAQVRQAMATTQVSLGDRTEEFTQVVERLSEQYLKTIEQLSEELGGYKEKIT